MLGVFQSRQPVRNEMAVVRVSIEGGDPLVEARIVVTPGDALSGAERFDGSVLVEPHRNRHFPRWRYKFRAVFMSENPGFFGREFVGLAGSVVIDIAGGGLAVEPEA